MNCIFCKFNGKCDGSNCYYDYIKEQRELQSGYDDKKYYLVNTCNKCAYVDLYSLREMDEYHEKNPNDDMHSFMSMDEITKDTEIKWETDDIWYQRGQEDARKIIKIKGLDTVFEWWKNYDRKDFVTKNDLGFFDELMSLARKSGLKNRN